MADEAVLNTYNLVYLCFLNHDAECGPSGNLFAFVKKIDKIFIEISIFSKIYESELCRWFRFAQLAKGKKFRP